MHLRPVVERAHQDAHRAPTFPLQSQYDSWQTGNVAGGADPTTENAFGKNLTSLVLKTFLNQPQHGIFLDSCHHHCGAWNGPVIDTMGSGAALNAWYTKGSGALPNKGFFNQNKPFPCTAHAAPEVAEDARWGDVAAFTYPHTLIAPASKLSLAAKRPLISN